MVIEATQVVRQLQRLKIDTARALVPDAELLSRAEALARDIRVVAVPDVTAVWHLRKAALKLRQGDLTGVIAEAQAARTALGGLRQGDLMVDAYVMEAKALDGLGDRVRLDRIVSEGIAVVEEHRHAASAPYLTAAYMRDRITLYALGVRAALQLDDIDKLVARAELSKCRLMRHAPADAEARALADELRAISARIDTAEAAGRDPGRMPAERRVLWDRYQMQRQTTPAPTVKRLAEAQAALNPGEAVIYQYWIDRKTLLHLTFDSHAHAVDLVEVSADDRAALADYTAYLARDDITLDDAKISQIDGFAPLIWPQSAAAQAILGGAHRLILSPHRMLHALPYAGLKLDQDFVLDRWALRYAPNLGTLLGLVEPAPRQAMLSVGIEEFDIPGQPLKPLPKTLSEAKDIASAYAAEGWQTATLTPPVTGGDISGQAQLNPAILHLSTHAKSVEADTPLESHLYLSNTRLDGLEIPLLGLSPSTVVLSACSAGQRAIAGRGMTELPGDDLHGLPAAFFATGARNLVAGLFPVNDHSSPQILAAFHAGLIAGQPPDIALAEAMRGYRREAFSMFKERRFWAPFTLTALGPNTPERTPT